MASISRQASALATSNGLQCHIMKRWKDIYRNASAVQFCRWLWQRYKIYCDRHRWLWSNAPSSVTIIPMALSPAFTSNNKKKVSDQTIERNEEIKRKQHPCLPGCLLSLHTLHDVIPPVCVCVLCCGIGIARCCPLRSFRLLSFHLQTEMTYYWIND